MSRRTMLVAFMLLALFATSIAAAEASIIRVRNWTNHRLFVRIDHVGRGFLYPHSDRNFEVEGGRHHDIHTWNDHGGNWGPSRVFVPHHSTYTWTSRM